MLQILKSCFTVHLLNHSSKASNASSAFITCFTCLSCFSNFSKHYSHDNHASHAANDSHAKIMLHMHNHRLINHAKSCFTLLHTLSNQLAYHDMCVTARQLENKKMRTNGRTNDK